MVQIFLEWTQLLFTITEFQNAQAQPLSQEDMDELERAIDEGKLPVRQKSVCDEEMRMTFGLSLAANLWLNLDCSLDFVRYRLVQQSSLSI